MLKSQKFLTRKMLNGLREYRNQLVNKEEQIVQDKRKLLQRLMEAQRGKIASAMAKLRENSAFELEKRKKQEKRLALALELASR